MEFMRRLPLKPEGGNQLDLNSERAATPDRYSSSPVTPR